jgi:DNA-binding NtrC family response regulator
MAGDTTEMNGDALAAAVARVFPISTLNPAMQRAIEQARRVAPTEYPVLILGPTGTGKELMARAVHAASRRSGAFVPINCGAIPDSLFEAELFGAQRGAYTGLDGDRAGLIQAAEKGTLFLDEVADIPLAVQAKLLRVLQDGEYRSLGASQLRRADVRIVAATHKPLVAMVEAGRFRIDLFYRISAATLQMPALRDRREDIPQLLAYAVRQAARAQRVAEPQIDPDVVEVALRHDWRGNIRELMHAVAVAVLHAHDGRLRASDLSAAVAPGGPGPQAEPPLAGTGPAGGYGILHRPDATPVVDPGASGSDARAARGHPAAELAARGIADRPFFEALAEFERAYLRDLLVRSGNNLSIAAEIAGIARSTIRDKARQHGLLGDDPLPRGRPPRSRVRGRPR